MNNDYALVLRWSRARSNLRRLIAKLTLNEKCRNLVLHQYIEDKRGRSCSREMLYLDYRVIGLSSSSSGGRHFLPDNNGSGTIKQIKLGEVLGHQQEQP